MSRTRICIVILTALLSVSLLNGIYLRFITDTLVAPLEEAETFASNGDWENAMELTRQAEENWNRHQLYFCTTLRREDTDLVELNFSQIEPLLRWQEQAEYHAANAALISSIHLLNGTESLDLKNIF